MGDIWPYGPPKYTNWSQCYAAMRAIGFDDTDADIMAAIAGSESAYDLRVVNDTPATGDYSVGIYQINYYASLYSGRVAEFGTPRHVANETVEQQCRNAQQVWSQQGYGAWGSYNNGEYKPFLHGAGGGGGGGGSSEPTLSEGSTGPAVTLLQRDLNITGAHLKVDGDFGPDTEAAVRHFQSVSGLTVDGVVGPDTWGELLSDVAARTSVPGPGGGSNAPAPPNEPNPNIASGVQGAWSNLRQQAGPYANDYLKAFNTLTHSSPAR